MAVKVEWDTTNKIIRVKDGITDIDIQVDFYSDGKEDWLVSEDLSKFEFPFRVVGGDDLAPGKIITPKYFLKAPWVIKPYEGNHELTMDGDLFSNESPPSGLTMATSGAYTATILFNRSFEAITTTVSTIETVPSGVLVASGTGSIETGMTASFIG